MARVSAIITERVDIRKELPFSYLNVVYCYMYIAGERISSAKLLFNDTRPLNTRPRTYIVKNVNLWARVSAINSNRTQRPFQLLSITVYCNNVYCQNLDFIK